MGSLEFTLSTRALVTAVAVVAAKTLVTRGSISRALLNLIKRLILVMFKDSYPLPMFLKLTFIFHL